MSKKWYLCYGYLGSFLIYSEGSQEPELGGPRTVGDSFEPLGVFVIVTWTRPSHLTNQNRINRMTKNTGVVNMVFYSIKLYLTRTRINNSGEVVKSGMWLIKIVLLGLKQEGDQKLNEPWCLGGASFYSFWGSSLSRLSVLESVLFAQRRKRES